MNGCKHTVMVLGFDYRGTISIKSTRERPPPGGSKSEYHHSPPALFIWRQIVCYSEIFIYAFHFRRVQAHLNGIRTEIVHTYGHVFHSIWLQSRWKSGGGGTEAPPAFSSWRRISYYQEGCQMTYCYGYNFVNVFYFVVFIILMVEGEGEEVWILYTVSCKVFILRFQPVPPPPLPL